MNVNNWKESALKRKAWKDLVEEDKTPKRGVELMDEGDIIW
jgi:hypothetical protein